MKISTITYRRLKNLGSYENATIELTAIVDEDDDPALVFQQLKSWADRQLQIKETISLPSLNGH